MDRSEETIGMKEQKDPAMRHLNTFDKEKLLAMQKQVMEGMTQNGSS